MNQPTEITFEGGYRRLEEIAALVNSEKVSVDEMCDLFAEGRGLDRALSAYLEEQKGRIERIERGEEIQAFRIVAPARADGETGAAIEPGGATAPGGASRSAGPDPGREDDIPF